MSKKLYTQAELNKAAREAKKGVKSSKKKRPLNAYMKAVQKARKSGAKSFSYGGNTYVAKKGKTGMITFAKQ